MVTYIYSNFVIFKILKYSQYIHYIYMATDRKVTGSLLKVATASLYEFYKENGSACFMDSNCLILCNFTWK